MKRIGLREILLLGVLLLPALFVGPVVGESPVAVDRPAATAFDASHGGFLAGRSAGEDVGVLLLAGASDVPGAQAAVSSVPQGSCSSAPAQTFTGSITVDDPSQTGRILRDGIHPTCDAGKANPGLYNATQYHYDVDTFQNTAGSTRCYTVTYEQVCAEAPVNLHLTAYSGLYDPAHPDQNYLADIGNSSVGEYSFVVPAGDTFSVVASQNDTSVLCTDYRWSLSECSCWSTALSGSLTPVDPLQQNRLTRDGVPSTCALPKSYPGTWSVADINYKTYSFYNPSGAPICYTVQANAPNCVAPTDMIFVGAYAGAYDPANQSVNYLADIGRSPTPNGSFSFVVPPQQDWRLLVTGVHADANCSAFTLDLSPCPNRCALPLVMR